MLNRLRLHKGFTLVELIVVIAIIGVLAAILIPTMIGYTESSKITSLNSTASDMRKEIEYFFTEADTLGYGMKNSASAYCEPVITVSNYVWSMTISQTPLSDIFRGTTIVWTGSANSVKTGDIKSGKNADELFLIKLADSFPEIENARIGMRLENGRCAALYFTNDTMTQINMQSFGAGGWSSDTYTWNNSKAGINDEGYYVGTSPVLNLA